PVTGSVPEGRAVVVDGEDDTGGVDVVLEPPAPVGVVEVDEGAVVVDGAPVVGVPGSVVVVGEDVLVDVGASVVVVVVDASVVVVTGMVVVVLVGFGMHFQP